MTLIQPLALLFDLDGTLVDSAPDIAAALDGALHQHDLPAAGIANTRQWVGGGAPKLVARALAALDPGNSITDAAFLTTFLKHYSHENGKHGAPYPGVIDTLRQCDDRGLRIACVTNKPTALAQALLEQYSIDTCFDVMVGGDTLPVKKPDPQPVLHACQQLEVDPTMAWMIGDSGADAGAAHAAGSLFIWVNYGYHRGENAVSLSAAATMADFDELIALLDATMAH